MTASELTRSLSSSFVLSAALNAFGSVRDSSVSPSSIDFFVILEIASIGSTA